MDSQAASIGLHQPPTLYKKRLLLLLPINTFII
jgi:hypothetical protein